MTTCKLEACCQEGRGACLRVCQVSTAIAIFKKAQAPPSSSAVAPAPSPAFFLPFFFPTLAAFFALIFVRVVPCSLAQLFKLQVASDSELETRRIITFTCCSLSTLCNHYSAVTPMMLDRSLQLLQASAPSPV